MIAIGVYFTGEPAEELIEHLAGFSEPLVERHEEAALIATIGISVLRSTFRGRIDAPSRILVSQGSAPPGPAGGRADGLDGQPRRPDTPLRDPGSGTRTDRRAITWQRF